MLRSNLAGELLTSAAAFVVWATGKWCCGHLWCQVGLEAWIGSLRHLPLWPICSSASQQLRKNVMDEYWLCCFVLLPLLYWHELIGQKQKADSVQSGKRFYVNRDCKIRNRAVRVSTQDSWPNTTCPQETVTQSHKLLFNRDMVSCFVMCSVILVVGFSLVLSDRWKTGVVVFYNAVTMFSNVGFMSSCLINWSHH